MQNQRLKISPYATSRINNIFGHLFHSFILIFSEAVFL